MKTFYTTAPVAYDGFGTKTVASGWQWVSKTRPDHRQPVRKVEVQDDHVEWQSMRYGNELYPTWTEAAFQEKKRYGYIKEKTDGSN